MILEGFPVDPLKVSGCTVTVKAEPNERYRTETAFFYALKKHIIGLGHDVIKKCPGNDGHLTGAPYYIRERKGQWCVWDGNYAIRAATRNFHDDGEVDLHFVNLTK
jgi:hypothetical protein